MDKVIIRLTTRSGNDYIVGEVPIHNDAYGKVDQIVHSIGDPVTNEPCSYKVTFAMHHGVEVEVFDYAEVHYG